MADTPKASPNAAEIKKTQTDQTPGAETTQGAVVTGQTGGPQTSLDATNPSNVPAEPKEPVTSTEAGAGNSSTGQSLEVADGHVLDMRDSADRAYMASMADVDEWPKRFVLVNGKHDGVDKNGDKKTFLPGDSVMLSEMGFKSFGDKFRLPN